MRAAKLVAAFITGTIFVSFVALAWTGPTSAPPNGNVSAPINVGTTYQEKQGILGALGILNTGSLILFGANLYLAFNSTADATGYGIRDNAGTLEFKNSRGSWSGFLPSTNVQSINFADGTTQTTAAAGGGIASCRVCTRFRYEWYGYKWSSQGCSPYSSGNTLQTAQSGGGYGYVVQVETSIQCQ